MSYVTACTGFRWGRIGVADALTDASVQAFNPEYVCCTLGLDMVTRITTLVLHTLPKGLFAWSSSSHLLTIVFIAMLLPLLAARVHTDRIQTQVSCRQTQHWVPRALNRGRKSSSLAHVNRKCLLKVTMYLDMMSACSSSSFFFFVKILFYQLIIQETWWDSKCCILQYVN